jgi:hypothetical protein
MKEFNNEKISLCQSMPSNPRIIFNYRRQEIVHIQQMNTVVNSSREYKRSVAFFHKELQYSEIESELMNTPVEHCIIDFHALFLRSKLEWLQKESNHGLTFYNQPTYQDILFKINHRYGANIKDHLGMKNLVSTQFIDS